MFESFFDGLLLLLGMALGWALSRAANAAKRDQNRTREEIVTGFSREGADDPDDAVAALSRAADGDPQAIGLQMTLGSLFRKRGETDRAIRVHEAIVARPGLSAVEFNQAQLELARDFLKAGLLDRAESLLEPMINAPDAGDALELLIELHEQTQGWHAAIDTAQRWQAVTGRPAVKRIAQYRCQLAEEARDRGDLAAANSLAENALSDDAACVRASLLLAKLAEAQQQWSRAIDHYLRAIEQDARFMVDAVEPLRRCYSETGDAEGYRQFLQDAALATPGSAAIAAARARWLGEQQQNPQAYLAEQLALRPTREGLLLWLDAHTEMADETQGLRDSLLRSVKNRPRYRCAACGLQPSLLFWQCPSCRQWGSVGPVEEQL
jgi:lipopolysaccharide biosynthesis regulator YciM